MRCSGSDGRSHLGATNIAFLSAFLPRFFSSRVLVCDRDHIPVAGRVFWPWLVARAFSSDRRHR